LLAALCLAPAAPGQAGKLSRVTAAGSKRFSAELVASASGLKPGDPVTKESIQAGADQLAQLGPFQNVRYKFQSKAEDVEVEYLVEDAPTVPVSFDNFATIPDEELHAALKQAMPFYDGTAPEQGAMLEVMTAALQKLIEAKGIKAAVERSVLSAPDSDGNIQQFKISAPAMKVKSVEFGDAVAAGSPKLSEPVRALINKPFSRYATRVFLVEQVRPLYEQRGFLRAHFPEPQARFVGNPNRPLPDEISVFVPIETGPVFKFTGVAWSGNTALDAAALNSLVPVPLGEVADGMKMTGTWERVKREYNRRGYIDAEVKATPVFDDAKNTVTYRVAVTEGAQFRMGHLVITGLSVTAERKLIAAWRLPAGDVFDQLYFEEFLDKQAQKRGAFGDYVVNFSNVGYLLRPDPKHGIVDVLMDFK